MILNYEGLCKVISGGQTGADMAGLVSAREAGLTTGGVAPAGFMTAIGPNPGLAEFGLTAHGTLKTRTVQNVLNSDGTVILAARLKSPGTVLTINTCLDNRRPYLVVDISALDNFLMGTGANPTGFVAEKGLLISNWIHQNNIRILNVAGNRQSKTSKIFEAAKTVLDSMFYTLDLRGLVVKGAEL